MCSHLGRAREAARGAALSARKKTARVRSRRKDGQLSSQPPPTAHFENSPASLQSYQEASVGELTRTGATLAAVRRAWDKACSARKGSGSARPQPGTLLSGVLSREAAQVPRSRSAQPFPCTLSRWISQPRWGHIGLSARAEVRQMLCNQEATGLDFTVIEANPKLIPPQLKHPCEAVLLLLQLGYRAHYPRDVCKRFPPLWAALVD